MSTISMDSVDGSEQTPLNIDISISMDEIFTDPDIFYVPIRAIQKKNKNGNQNKHKEQEKNGRGNSPDKPDNNNMSPRRDG